MFVAYLKNNKMKKQILTLLMVIVATISMVMAQNDQIFFHNGKTINANISLVDDFKVIYKYVGENAEQTTSKMAIGKIIYSSGREEIVTEKIVINGKEDWEKVEVLMDKSEIVGMKKVGDVQGKTTGFFSSYTSAAGTDKRSLKKLLEAAAALNAPFVYITADKDTKGGMQTGSYGAQGNKKGIAYTY